MGKEKEKKKGKKRKDKESSPSPSGSESNYDSDVSNNDSKRPKESTVVRLIFCLLPSASILYL